MHFPQKHRLTSYYFFGNSLAHIEVSKQLAVLRKKRKKNDYNLDYMSMYRYNKQNDTNKKDCITNSNHIFKLTAAQGIQTRPS